MFPLFCNVRGARVESHVADHVCANKRGNHSSRTHHSGAAAAAVRSVRVDKTQSREGSGPCSLLTRDSLGWTSCRLSGSELGQGSGMMTEMPRPGALCHPWSRTYVLPKDPSGLATSMHLPITRLNDEKKLFGHGGLWKWQEKEGRGGAVYSLYTWLLSRNMHTVLFRMGVR